MLCAGGSLGSIWFRSGDPWNRRFAGFSFGRPVGDDIVLPTHPPPEVYRFVPKVGVYRYSAWVGGRVYVWPRFVRRIIGEVVTAGSQTLTQFVRFDNVNTFHAGRINFRLPQFVRFNNVNTFPAGRVNFQLLQSVRFDNVNTFPAGRINFRLPQLVRFDNVNIFPSGVLIGGTIVIQSSPRIILIRRR